MSIRIGTEDDPDFILIDLNYSTVTTPIALKARRDFGAATRTIEQWDDVLWKLCRQATDQMGDAIKFDEKRRNI